MSPSLTPPIKMVSSQDKIVEDSIIIGEIRKGAESKLIAKLGE